MPTDISTFIKNLQKSKLFAECPYCGQEFSLSKATLFDGRKKFPEIAENKRLEWKKELDERLVDLKERKMRATTGAEKTFSSYVKGRIIAAIIIAVIGILGFSLNQFGPRFYDVPIMFDYIWLVLPIIAVIIALVKAKTRLIISIDLVGESYKYKGQKETQSQDIEKRELLDIVSDVRITLKGFPILSSYFPKEFEDDFKNDLKYVNSKIEKEVVPEFRVPST